MCDVSGWRLNFVSSAVFSLIGSRGCLEYRGYTVSILVIWKTLLLQSQLLWERSKSLESLVCLFLANF